MAKEESSIAKQFFAPNGTAITISHERYFMTETLFKPAFLNMAAPGIHEMLYSSIVLCDADIRKDLYANIVLTGGSSLFPGLKDRMYYLNGKHIRRFFPVKLMHLCIQSKIHAPIFHLIVSLTEVH